jgi:hypothetical protein
VGRKISGDWDRRRRKYRRGGQEALRPRRMDILSICGSFWLPDNSRIIAELCSFNYNIPDMFQG